jgi:hypothetical protein
MYHVNLFLVSLFRYFNKFYFPSSPTITSHTKPLLEYRDPHSYISATRSEYGSPRVLSPPFKVSRLED